MAHFPNVARATSQMLLCDFNEQFFFHLVQFIFVIFVKLQYFIRKKKCSSLRYHMQIAKKYRASF